MGRPKSIISKSELAKELSLSKGRISQLVKAGLPVRPDGRVDRGKALAWIEAHVRHQAKPGPRKSHTDTPALGVQSPETEPESEPADTRDRSEQTTAPADEKFSEARVRRERAEADLSEMAAAKMRGEYAELAAVKRMVGGLVVACKTRLLAIGNKLAPELAADGDPARIQAKIDGEVREALTELSHWEPDTA